VQALGVLNVTDAGRIKFPVNSAGTSVNYEVVCKEPALSGSWGKPIQFSPDAESAVVAGDVNAGGCVTDLYVIYGDSADALTRTTMSTIVPAPHTSLSGVGIVGLSPQTTYFYKVVATNKAGTTYVGPFSFTTPK
jgi:hypothetical protein